MICKSNRNGTCARKRRGGVDCDFFRCFAKSEIARFFGYGYSRVAVQNKTERSVAVVICLNEQITARSRAERFREIGVEVGKNFVLIRTRKLNRFRNAADFNVKREIVFSVCVSRTVRNCLVYVEFEIGGRNCVALTSCRCRELIHFDFVRARRGLGVGRNFQSAFLARFRCNGRFEL